MFAIKSMGMENMNFFLSTYVNIFKTHNFFWDFVVSKTHFFDARSFLVNNVKDKIIDFYKSFSLGKAVRFGKKIA